MKPAHIPRAYDQTYTDTVDGFLLVFNPVSEKGPAVLNREAAFLFSFIDGKRTLGDILRLASGKDPHSTFQDISRVFTGFITSEIAYIGRPKSIRRLFSKRPVHLGVWLHITNQCNLRCTYCYIGKTSEQMTESTADQALEKIIHDGAKHGFTKFTVKVSGGECLLRMPEILRLVKLGRSIARTAGVSIEFVALTNGVLITEKIARTLKAEGIRAAVSLDGLAPYHDAQRVFSSGLGSFAYVVRGIENLQHAGVPFNVSVTITGKNAEHIPELTRWMLARHIPFAFNFYRENPYVAENLTGNNIRLVQALRQAYACISANPPMYSILNSLLDRVSFRHPHRNTCGMGRNYVVVRHDGKITACQMTIDSPVGSLDDPDIIQTMQKGNFIRPRGLTVERMSPCKTCQWRYACSGGCPLLTYEQKGSYAVRSPYCSVYKALIPEVLRTEAKRLIKYGYRHAGRPASKNI